MTEYWAVFPVLDSRFLLVIYFKIAMCPSTEKMVSLQVVQRLVMELQPTSSSLLQGCCSYITGCASTPCWAFRILLLNVETSEFCAIMKQHLWFQNLFLIWHWDIWRMWPVVAGEQVRLANRVHLEGEHSRARHRQHLLWQSPWAPARFLGGSGKRPSSRRWRERWDSYVDERSQPRDGRLACARDDGRGHLTPGDRFVFLLRVCHQSAVLPFHCQKRWRVHVWREHWRLLLCPQGFSLF